MLLVLLTALLLRSTPARPIAVWGPRFYDMQFYLIRAIAPELTWKLVCQNQKRRSTPAPNAGVMRCRSFFVARFCRVFWGS